jgi:hypothetical protein
MLFLKSNFMKTRNILKGLTAIALMTTVSLTAVAQEKKTTAGKVIHKTGKAAKSVGNKTAEVAAKGTAKVVDAKWKGKMGPDGSDVYIDGKNNKYYVNAKGAKIYLKASQIKDRPAN